MGKTIYSVRLMASVCGATQYRVKKLKDLIESDPSQFTKMMADPSQMEDIITPKKALNLRQEALVKTLSTD